MIELILACAPTVSPHTIQEIIRVESSGNPIAVSVNIKNGVTFKHKKPKTKQDAIAVAKEAIAVGHTVDMGYMQVNSANLKKLGYSIGDMFDPCKNITAGALILTTAYSDALPRHSDEQAALRAALSRYNTGNFSSGFRNGYVAKYTGYVPAIKRKERIYEAETTVFSRTVRLTLSTELE
ncbi:MAG: lytic transglycosylase domain-containing protein [Pseudomonadota bacterium]|nr:lytic transglycosylase domain-containing protein [Pseudomonadota bacterium]